ncbi:MAG: hypothetical protein AB7S41_11345 [Parvibaculaceae bacterium]
MTAVRLVSATHLLWGLMLLLLPPPQPFGAFAPYLWAISEQSLAWLFILTAILPSAARWCARRACYWAVLLPQQAVLFFACGWSLAMLLDGYDPRLVYPLAYLLPFTFWHVLEVKRSGRQA